MPVSTNVTLSDKWRPIFPDRCVVCHRSAPEGAAKLTGFDGNPLLVFLLPIFYLFGWRHTEVPVCPGCKRKFYAQRYGWNLAAWALAFVAVGFLYPLYSSLSGGIKRLVVCGAALVVLLPFWLIEAFLPKYFDITASNAPPFTNSRTKATRASSWS